MITKTRHIPDGKKHLKRLPLIHYLQAEYLYYPITSQRCPEGETCVIYGQFVKVGEVIGTRRSSYFEQPIHATVSGEIVGYEKKIDQGGKLVDCLIVKNDFKYDMHESVKERSELEIERLTKDAFIDITKQAGLVGLGGSGFPTYIKLSTKHQIHTVLANGVECEPNLISDYEVMMDYPEEVVKGLVYTMRALSAKRGVIAIKEHYHELIERMRFALKGYSQYDIVVQPVGNYYPQGWENEAIDTALNIKVQQGKLPAEYGVMVFNVSTLQSIYHAVKHGLPVLERYFTISGNGIANESFKARNICAHDERLYNIVLSRESEIKDTRYHVSLSIPQVNTKYSCGKKDFFAILITLKEIIKKRDFTKLISEIDSELIKIASKLNSVSVNGLMIKMGLPGNWKQLSTL